MKTNVPASLATSSNSFHLATCTALRYYALVIKTIVSLILNKFITTTFVISIDTLHLMQAGPNAKTINGQLSKSQLHLSEGGPNTRTHPV